MISYDFYIRVEVNGERRVWINNHCVYPLWRLERFNSEPTNRLKGLDNFIAEMQEGLADGERFWLYQADLSLDFFSEEEVHIYEDSPSEEILKLPIEVFKKFLYDYRDFLEIYESNGIPGLPFVEQV